MGEHLLKSVKIAKNKPCLEIFVDIWEKYIDTQILFFFFLNNNFGLRTVGKCNCIALKKGFSFPVG